MSRKAKDNSFKTRTSWYEQLDLFLTLNQHNEEVQKKETKSGNSKSLGKKTKSL